MNVIAACILAIVACGLWLYIVYRIGERDRKEWAELIRHIRRLRIVLHADGTYQLLYEPEERK